MVERVTVAAQQERCLGSLRELHSTVVTDVQLAGSVADRRRLVAGVPSDDEQQLVKRRRQTGPVRGLLAPAHEVAKLASEEKQALVVSIRQRALSW